MDAGPKQDLWNILPVIIVLLLGAAYFAVMETAFASASRIRLKAAADHGNRRAEQALYVLDHFDQAITTLLIGTNILHLTIATLVTVAVQRQWGMWAVTAGTLVTTVVVFFAGEMLPKSIAKKYAERLAMHTARSLRFFMVLFKPLSALLTAFGNAVARRVQSEPAVTVTEDELADIIENMTDDGELTAERGELMSSALSFADVPVESVITARVDVAAVDVDDPPEEILAYVREQRHSRLPVYADSIDNVIGILQIRKYIKACIAAGGKAVDVRPLLDEPVFVHQSTLIAEVLPADKADPDNHELADLEVFEFPGGVFRNDDADAKAKLRTEEQVGHRERHFALTAWPDVAAGRSFHFEGDPDGMRAIFLQSPTGYWFEINDFDPAA